MIVVTAASGRYGRLVVEALLRRGVPAGDIVAAVRSPDKVADLAAKGVQVREADYDRPETLVSAFAGADTVLLIPSVSIGQRFAQMQRAADAAMRNNVSRIAYAGFVNGDTSTLKLGEEHKQMEAYIRSLDVAHTLLRNGAYIEVYAGDLGDIGYALAQGVLISSAGDGKVSGASRGDLAEAAAVALTTPTDGNVVYELGGTAFTKSDIAESISRHTGKPLVHRDLPVAEYEQVLKAAGLPDGLAAIVADTSFSITRGDWYTESKDLEKLLGRPSTPMHVVVGETLARNGLL
ncbi:NmrA-like family protein (plasmid) [Rhizobium phaseoli]|uniref:SDR family oxidoreductase n=1 Tax=Rhizobium phaseoli TaxID=396 RepID=UPI0007EA49B1|nr:SDR family oxidoreductase [Rhizobium phaseoli]ANL51084.1 NmrA-like family protein [Rhizobium phaseoli]